ncbi:MAG: DUF4349 domain-containing protein [Bacteroidales bacterium]|nr:DUF4349 domain-containing protein [Bacteroidales bacterium]
MKAISIFFAIILVVLSCSSGVNYKSAPMSETTKASEAIDGQSSEVVQHSMESSDDVATINIQERKLIKEGSIWFETENVGRTRQRIIRLTNQMKGYISKEYSNKYSEQQRYEMTIRIPSVNFDLFMDSLSGFVTKFDNKDIQVKDVTEEYVDVETRIKTKQEVLSRYRELLKQAKTVSEMLDVQRELGNVQTELESFQGRLKYLQNQVSYSTLNITFYEYQTSEFGFWKKIGKAFVSGWEGLLSFIVIMVNLWPLWLIVAIILVGLRWLLKKRKN